MCVSMCFRVFFPPNMFTCRHSEFKTKIRLTYSCTEFGRESSRTGPFSGSVRLKSKVILTESRKSCLSYRSKQNIFYHWYHICCMFWPCYVIPSSAPVGQGYWNIFVHLIWHDAIRFLLHWREAAFYHDKGHCWMQRLQDDQLSHPASQQSCCSNRMCHPSPWQHIAPGLLA